MPLGPIMLDLAGTVLQEPEKKLLLHPYVGGVIYFGRNYESPAQIKALSDSIRELRPELLIAVDQEGGRVQRFRQGFTRLPAMQQFLPLYRKDSEKCLVMVKNSGWLMASELLAVGVDFSFAPVLDVDDNKCSIVADRSFSPRPLEVTTLAAAWMEGMCEAGMSTTGKHFPGHGSVTVDSHLTQPVDVRVFADITKHDLVPFTKLLPSLDAIMPAHIVFSNVDKNNTVGFSSYWLQTILRERLGFTGLIFSDDLSMKGAHSVGGYIARAQQALNAGCDMILVCNNREGVVELLNSKRFMMKEEESQRLSLRLSTMSAKHLSNTHILSIEALQQSLRWQLSREAIQVLM